VQGGQEKGYIKGRNEVGWIKRDSSSSPVQLTAMADFHKISAYRCSQCRYVTLWSD